MYEPLCKKICQNCSKDEFQQNFNTFEPKDTPMIIILVFPKKHRTKKYAKTLISFLIERPGGKVYSYIYVV
jgi:hypothetical protein